MRKYNPVYHNSYSAFCFYDDCHYARQAGDVAYPVPVYSGTLGNQLTTWHDAAVPNPAAHFGERMHYAGVRCERGSQY